MRSCRDVACRASCQVYRFASPSNGNNRAAKASVHYIYIFIYIRARGERSVPSGGGRYSSSSFFSSFFSSGYCMRVW